MSNEFMPRVTAEMEKSERDSVARGERRWRCNANSDGEDSARRDAIQVTSIGIRCGVVGRNRLRWHMPRRRALKMRGGGVMVRIVVLLREAARG